MTTTQAQEDTKGQQNGLIVNDAHLAPAVFPENSEPVSVKSPLRLCVCCTRHFIPAGKENVCPDCESGEAFKKSCTTCHAEFDADDPGQSLCDWCHSEASHHDRELQDYIDNR